jgi:hypothetical protein
MIYFLLVIFLADGVYVESYETRAECESRRIVIKGEVPQASTKCIRMGSKNYV